MAHIVGEKIEVSRACWLALFNGGLVWVQVPKRLDPKERDTIGLFCGSNLGVARIVDILCQGTRVTEGHVACLFRFKIPE